MNAQEWVLRWFEFAVASTLLLGAIAWGVARLRQPIDRANLIVLGLLATALLPVSLSLLPGPVGMWACSRHLSPRHSIQRLVLHRRAARIP